MTQPNKQAGVRRGRPPRVDVHARLEAEVVGLRERLGGLPVPMEAEEIWRGIWLEEAHNSTAIEGNTLVLKQVEALLREGRAVGNKALSEYLEVTGYAAAANWVYERATGAGKWDQRKLISVAEIRHIHVLAMTPVWEVAPHPEAGEGEPPGSFREHDIAAFPGGMKPPPWHEVSPQLATWVDDACKLGPSGDPPISEQLAALHTRFEQIHPFLDGNGRTGRLVLNLLLVRLGFPPAIIYKTDRRRYLEALRQADQGTVGPLGEFIARAVLDNLYKFVVPAVSGPARLVALPALADARISANALRVAAVRGRLQAARGPDGRWRSSRIWVDGYLAARHRRA